MKNNGTLASLEPQISSVLKNILKEIEESYQNCQSEGTIHRHHKLAAKNIEINLREVENLIGSSFLLRSLYEQATRHLEELNKLLRKSVPHKLLKQDVDDVVLRSISPSIQTSKLSEQLKTTLKRNRMLELQNRSLKQTLDNLNQEKSGLLQRIRLSQQGRFRTETIFSGFSEKLAAQDQEYEQKRRLMAQEIEEMRNQLTDHMTRNQLLVKQNNKIQLEKHQLIQIKNDYERQMNHLLGRIDVQINQFTQRVVKQRFITEQSQQKCSILQQQMDEAYQKLKQSQNCVQVLRETNHQMKQRINKMETQEQAVECILRTQQQSNKENYKLRCLEDLHRDICTFKQQQLFRTHH